MIHRSLAIHFGHRTVSLITACLISCKKTRIDYVSLVTTLHAVACSQWDYGNNTLGEASTSRSEQAVYIHLPRKFADRGRQTF